MSSQIPLQLASLPPPLGETVAKRWAAFAVAAEQAGVAPPLDDALLNQLCRVWAGSEFVAQLCVRYPRLLADLLDSGDLQAVYPADGYLARAQAALAEADDADSLGEALRRLRRREMLRIAWRDLAGLAELDETMANLSALAEACIESALQMLHGWQQELYGTPQGPEGEPQQMVVLGMGKLGARELNFSSDIDLIFAFPEDGEVQGGRKEMSNEEYFTRLGRSLIRSLDEKTAEGFVFRVDMRLRPFGESGALALSFEAMENYYQVHGRDWERYAMIKARVVAGDRAAGDELLGLLRPFVYRRYLDYGAFAALREMKAMVAAEVKRKGMQNHVKLGAGGIREVEFIGQAFQLIRGGRDPELQRREIQQVLGYLAAHNYLPGYVVQQLLEAYVFLRNTEHCLQEYQDQQTHLLPEDDYGQQVLAFAMGYEHWDDFLPVLRAHMARVHSHFEQIFEAPQTDQSQDAGRNLDALWRGSLDETQALALLTEEGFQDAEAVLHQLTALRSGRRYGSMSSSGRNRMDQFMPLLLGACGGSDEPDEVLRRLLVLVEAIARRSVYFALLVENPLALSQLVKLCAVSPWIANQLARYPVLLDELLDARTLYKPPVREVLETDLAQRLARVPAGDLEQAMEVLRQFKQTSVLRVAAADVMEAVPLMVVSDHLSYIAEVILAQVLELAWHDLVARHGRPSCAKNDVDKGFAMVAYGKLGGLELSYSSDLDLVFVHGSEDPNAMTDGAKPVADSVFFARLAQRIIHLLTAHTPSGVLYEVDMRLRPSGASGLMVVSLASLAAYQQSQAWTWEHQALVRARVVAGDVALAQGFVAMRLEVLGRQRNAAQLRQEVREMREKMRDSLSREEPGEFDLKQGHGGIADIEFMVQYGVLRWTCDVPALAEYTDNVRILAALAENGFLAPADAAALSDAYRSLRAKVHRLALQEQPAVVAAEQFAAERAVVTRLWQTVIEHE